MLFKNSVHCPLSTVIYCAVWRSLYVCLLIDWYCHYSRFCSHLYTCPPHSHSLAWFWWSHLSVIILVKKSLAYFLIVNLTRPPCIKSKSSLLISMSLTGTNKEYLYSRKTRLRSKVSLSEFYGPWAWLYLGMPNFLFVFCRRYARWMGRWMSDSLERTTGGWVLFIEHYVCTVPVIETYMHMVMK